MLAVLSFLGVGSGVMAPAPALAQLPDSLDGVAYQVVDGVRARVHHAPQDARVAARVLALLDRMPPLPGLPDSLPFGIEAVLAHSPEAFDEVTGGTVPEWRAGVAIPSRSMLVMPTGEGVRVVDGEGLRTLRHEWAHLGLHAYLEGLRIPRWFDEGYAEWASGGFDVAGAWRLRVSIATGRTPPMDSLTLSWPRQREAAQTAYLLAGSAVSYLLEAGGERGLSIFLQRWRRDRSFEGSFRETFGVTTGQFEEDWRKQVRDRYGWLFVLSHSSIFWMVLALVLLWMVRVRQRYNREKLARLRARELPDDPAFWMSDEDEADPIHRPAG
jgi:hypothetical protein